MPVGFGNPLRNANDYYFNSLTYFANALICLSESCFLKAGILFLPFLMIFAKSETESFAISGS